jgi:hypothetical protein
VIAQVLGDPTPQRRARWLQTLGRGPDDPLRVTGFADRRSVSFIVMGDTGEGDNSQYRVVPSLLRQGQDTDFLFLCSDVVYPAGGIEEYGTKVTAPYRDYRGPIYGIPGNHGWFDDADGFMYWFCNANQRPSRQRGLRPRVRDRLWRRSPQGRIEALLPMAAVRELPVSAPAALIEIEDDDHRHLQFAPAGDSGQALVEGSSEAFRQPGPYFALDAGPLKVVALDLGVSGRLDTQQAAWLLRTSREPGPKILILERPLYVDGRAEPQPIHGGGTVHAIVTNPDHEYLAVIAGNTHNYQRYMVTLDDRKMPFIVAGGGGGFLHETHTIPNLDHNGVEGVNEDAFRCYPLRGDSLARCAQLWDKKLGGHGRILSLDPDVAAYIAAERIGLESVRRGARDARPSLRDYKVADLMYRAPGRPHALLHSAFSSLLDWGEPPLFKHFLRVDVTPDEVSIACHAVTGCAKHVDVELVEDRLVATRSASGWAWTVNGIAT